MLALQAQPPLADARLASLLVAALLAAQLLLPLCALGMNGGG